MVVEFRGRLVDGLCQHEEKLHEYHAAYRYLTTILPCKFARILEGSCVKLSPYIGSL